MSSSSDLNPGLIFGEFLSATQREGVCVPLSVGSSLSFYFFNCGGVNLCVGVVFKVNVC